MLSRRWTSPEDHIIILLAIISSFISVAKTASEGQAMWLIKKVPPISHWIPLFPYFILTTITRTLTIVILISYLNFLSILPIAILFLTGILTGYFAGNQRGMSCFNCGPSSLLSSAFFTTLKESSTKSSVFYLWNTLISFMVSSTWISILCILMTLKVNLVTENPVFECQENYGKLGKLDITCSKAVPVFSCYYKEQIRMENCYSDYRYFFFIFILMHRKSKKSFFIFQCAATLWTTMSK